jgi:hypothetical protein
MTHIEPTRWYGELQTKSHWFPLQIGVPLGGATHGTVVIVPVLMGMQSPAPSHALDDVTDGGEPEQTCPKQNVDGPGYVQFIPSCPSHTAEQTMKLALAQGGRDPRGEPVIVVHTPKLPVLHAWHCPVQEESQQFPSTQCPLWQSPLPLQE